MRTLVIALLILCLPLWADGITLKAGVNEIRIEDARESSHIIVRCEIAHLENSVVETRAGKFNLLTIPGFQTSQEVGKPNVPVMLQLVEVPVGAELSVRVLSSNETEYDCRAWGIENPLMPRQPSHRKDQREFPFEYDRNAYQIDEYASLPLVTISDSGILRSHRIATLQISPIAYNPVQNKIRVHNDIELEIALTNSDRNATSDLKEIYDSPYFSWVQDRLLVPSFLKNSASRDLSKAVVYAIVSDRMFESALQPFIAWKTEKGFVVKVAYTDQIGKTTEEIKKHLHGLYNNADAANPAPTFVLLVGDREQVPAFSGTQGSYITDLYYATATAGDILPDMFYGRFSAQKVEDLTPQIEKTISYEKYDFPDPSFLKKAVMIAGWDSSHAKEWGYPQINYGIKYYFNSENGYDNVYTYLSAGSHQNETKIRENVSAGAAIVNYTAHGSSTDWSDPNFTKANIASLMNTKRYHLAIGNCCLTNKFDVETCFGEAWLRAVDKGAIGYIGGSSYTYWDEDLWWGVGNYSIAHPNPDGASPDKLKTGTGAYDVAFSGKNNSNAQIMVAGNMAVEESTSPRKVYYWEVYHLMGDPSLCVYWGVPTPLQISHPEAISQAKGYLEIDAEEGTRVAVSVAGNLHASILVGSDRKAIVSIDSLEGIAKIVATKANRQPYIEEVNIVK